MDRRHQVLILIVFSLVLLGSGYKLALIQNGDARDQDVLSAGEMPEIHTGDAGDVSVPGGEKPPAEVVVHVVGAVKKPGVYSLPAGARVVDAVNAALPGEDARLDLLNLAAPLQDGCQVYVFSAEDYRNSLAGESGPAGPSPAGVGPVAMLQVSGTGNGGLININTAGQSQLETLPGIGPALAGRIIDYRNTNGPFLSPADIKNVSGIGEKRFEQIKDKITVN